MAGTCFVSASEAECCRVPAAGLQWFRLLHEFVHQCLSVRSSGCLPGTRSLTPCVTAMQDLLHLMTHKEASKQEAIQDAVAQEKQKAAARAELADMVRLSFSGLV